MDQTQKQVQHTSGPFDPSLYHRNNGAQRYAPVDAYNRNSQGSGYYHHGGNSQDRWVYDCIFFLKFGIYLHCVVLTDMAGHTAHGTSH